MAAGVAEKSVVDQITDLIQPYCHLGGPLPFSDAEVMAMILARARTELTFVDLFAHVQSTFHYFSYQGSIDTVQRRQAMPEFDTLQARLEDALRLYELPVTTKNILQSSDEDEGGIPVNIEYKVHSLSDGGDAIFLQKHLPSAWATGITNKRFDLFGLPRELEDMIYKLVLSFPLSAIRINAIPPDLRHCVYAKTLKTTLMTRDMDEDISFKAWRQAADPRANDSDVPMHLPPLGDILKPFLASRTLWNETKKIFWEINRFHCLTVKDLHHFFKKLPDSYRAYLKHLSFAYVPDDRKIAHKMFPQVASLTALSKLRIRIDKKI